MRIGRFVKPVETFDSSTAPSARGAGGLRAALETRLNAGGLPPEIAFLSGYGVPLAQLVAAADRAHKEGVSPDRALLANGVVEERFFYQCLARHLGVGFIDDDVQLVNGADAYPRAIHEGYVTFAGSDGSALLAAPRGAGLAALLWHAKREKGFRSRLAITMPSHLSRCVRSSAARRIAADASFGLLSAAPVLSAHSGSNLFQRCFVCIGAVILALSFLILPLAAANVWSVVVGLMFLAAILFRLFVSAAAMGAPHMHIAPLDDHQLPNYTILVALYKEARIVRRLMAMLDQLDYPRAKLDIKIVLEEDDVETRHALEALRLAPVYEIIVAPPGQPRTKPRALNVALPLARGTLIAVFDAEDAPDPQQLRRAAAQFARAPSRLACLQARLAIDNLGDSWLTRLFAIEYGALFHLQNIGLADLGLPIPVSGSSNHFRTSVLREVHGWDAWNVTEDADIGLRLARFGYRVGVLDSTTHEEAPVTLKAWFGQRRRWFKGWLQTFVTISRSPIELVTEIGASRSGALALLFLGLLFGPLFWIPSSIIMISDIVSNGLWSPTNISDVCLATLWASVTLLGISSLFWHAFVGMRRQRLLQLWPALALLLPYYCLHAIAAWMAFYELFSQPFHWHKTEHGLARNPYSRPAELAVDKRLG